MATPTPTPPAPVDEAPAGAPLEAGELAARALDAPLTRLTPATLAALNQTWRDCVLADDDESRGIARRIVARLRRATHQELHPGCERVTIDVPQLPTGHFVRINTREYIGKCDVWLCEAQTILELVHRARAVDDARLRDDQRQRSFDLDRSALVARAALIQSA